MRYFIRYFLRGLLFIAPVAATVWILVTVFLWVDGLVESPFGTDWTWTVPGTDLELRHGIGFALTIALVTLVGLLTSTVFVGWILRRIEVVFTRLPVVKLVYTAVKDVVEAFVSEEKKFDKPVLLAFGQTPEVEVIGFVTRQTLAEFGRPGKVAVYVPQSYNFAANLILVPADRVTPLELPAADVMAFVVSGGVSEATRIGDANESAG
jgi:uncharacterized membrane protein